MNSPIPSFFLPFAVSLGYWLIAKGLAAAGVTLKWAAKKSWPIALVLLALATSQAQAGWFTRGPDPKAEAANRALERAAQIAAEAASTQAQERGRLLQAIEALSNERTHLAKHLEHLGTLASRDSAYAAALQAAVPLLVAVAVLALGCAAIWLVTRSGSQDAELAAVLVDEVCATGIGLVGPCGQGLPKTHPGPAHLTGANREIDIYSGSKEVSSLPSPSLAEEPARQSPKSQEGELSF
jgi:hypothetical protein